MNKPKKQLVGIKYEILPLKILKETPGNPQKLTQQEINGMIKSMKDKGWILDAPVVWKKGDNDYQILSGHHRVQAGIEAGIVETGCKVVEGITEEQARVFVLEANQRRGRFDEFMFDDFVDDIINDFNIDKEILFDEIGLYGENSIEDYSDFEKEIKDLDGFENIDVLITIPKKYELEMRRILTSGKSNTANGMGQGVLELCGLL